MSICFISYHYLRLNLSFSNKCQLYSKFTKSAWERVVMPHNTTLILSIGVDHCCFSNDQYCSVDFSTMNIRRNNSKHWVLFVIITKRELVNEQLIIWKKVATSNNTTAFKPRVLCIRWFEVSVYAMYVEDEFKLKTHICLWRNYTKLS